MGFVIILPNERGKMVLARAYQDFFVLPSNSRKAALMGLHQASALGVEWREANFLLPKFVFPVVPHHRLTCEVV